MPGTSPWKRLSGELLAAVDRDFERAVLAAARAIWPALVQPRGLAQYDRAGADLIAFKDDGGIDVVIQCKGFFKAEGLQNDQFPAFAKSISSFANSGLTTDTYVVIHNQDARNQKVAGEIDTALLRLVATGSAKAVIQWDRQSFLRVLEEKLREMVSARVGEQSRLMLEQIDRQFAYGRTYVPQVPVRQGTLSLRRDRPPEVQFSKQVEAAVNIAEALANATGRWTLLTGIFGTGKTTAALHAARLSPNRIIYVHAGNIEPRFGEGGTHALMTRILDALAVFADFEADERGLFERLSAPMLRQLLQDPDSDALLIIDALDENRALRSPDAVTRFASALAELRCPIIMTTRQEHFRATFGNFDHLFEELSIKGGNTRDVALLELEPWSDREVHALVDAVNEEMPHNAGLKDLSAELRSGSATGWGEEFLRHPFFLRMIIDLAAEGGSPSETRASLIGQWVWRKLTRDLKSARVTPVPPDDRNGFLEKMEEVMTAVAGAMVEGADGETRLFETISSDAVIEICEAVLQTKGIDLASAISVTLLLPTSVRHRGSVPIRFSHRAFQEYFLARHLIEAGAATEGYPPEVRLFCRELEAEAARARDDGARTR